MTTFDTPTPPSLSVDLAGRADITIVASNRTDTVVEVRPRSASRALDARAAEQVTVDHTDGRVSVKSRSLRLYSWFSDGGAVDVSIQAPIGTEVYAHSGMGDVRCVGEFGASELTSAMGTITAEYMGALHARTGQGDVNVERSAGRADITTGSGKLRIGQIDGDAAVKNGNGDTFIGDVTGALEVKAANGDIVIDRATSAVTARASNGSIRVDEAIGGSVTLQAAYGSLEVGVREGSAAWLDLSTKFGQVRNELDATSEPGDATSTVEIRARNAYGDITIRRSASSL
ncbi:DUF4097 family beta strand repeat-containing protein [Glaciihabitans sp. dw_435]|uniref:DUF4097 family beta strand repeat-containing protein n=1 Tax=Glaciihabitans sp. dw_435 TaxID=2720081 RepID=UPI001BD55F00|nr:DUF4097 family beta strand repeat-containing protein [Glaciihabitans sp. dw_435]